MLFSAAVEGGAVFETADCSAGVDANETEHADWRLGGVFILCEEGRRCEYAGKGGNVWPTR